MKEITKTSFADRFFPYWFYPLLLLAVAATLFIAYSMAWVGWKIFLYVFYWLVNR